MDHGEGGQRTNHLVIVTCMCIRLLQAMSGAKLVRVLCLSFPLRYRIQHAHHSISHSQAPLKVSSLVSTFRNFDRGFFASNETVFIRTLR